LKNSFRKIFGFKSLKIKSKKTYAQQTAKRAKGNIWVIDRVTGYGGKYLGHVNADSKAFIHKKGYVHIRWDLSNPNKCMSFPTFNNCNAGTDLISKKDFFKYCKVVYDIPSPEAILAEDTIVIDSPETL